MKTFSTAANNSHSENQDSIKLRDYFAAKAMQEILKDYFMEDRYIGDKLDFVDMYTEDRVAQLSYGMADAMLKARDDC
jgi:hypothetical protein